MAKRAHTVILGSRSPRRRELLELLVPDRRIVVLPPRSADEPGFDDLADRAAILERLRAIARAKSDDVLAQVVEEWPGRDRKETRDLSSIIVTADTIILAHDAAEGPVVLGQPPGDDGGETVRRWFRDFLFGRTHEAITAVCVRRLDEGKAAEPLERGVITRVTFRDRDDELLEWYIGTGEPFGKAGAYGIQGAGSLFATKIEGSLSNVVGLPLEALRELLQRAMAALDQSHCAEETVRRPAH